MLRRVLHDTLSGVAKGAGSMFVLAIFATIYQFLPIDEPLVEVDLDGSYLVGLIVACVFMGVVGGIIFGTGALLSELSDAIERWRGNSK